MARRDGSNARDVGERKGDNPSSFKEAKNSVENASWDDCQELIGKLNRFGVAPTGFEFALPPEPQWEYACRAGTSTPFNFGSELNGNKANCDGINPYTVRGVIKKYRDGGIEAIVRTNYHCPQSSLEQYKTSIIEEFTKRPPTTSNEAAHRIK